MLLLPGMYMAADSPIHRLDPRVKMGASLALMVLPFSIHRPLAHLALVGAVAAVAWLARAPLKPLMRTLRTAFWLAVIMFVFYFFTTPGRPLVSVGGVTVTQEGLIAGGLQVYRICLLVIVAALLTYTTSPLQMTHALESLLGPLARLGLPVREVGMVMTIALRFVPTFFDEMETLMRAQQARGAEIGSGPPWRRLRSLVPVMVPLFVLAFRRAEDLAVAMEARGFRCSPQRTRLYRLSLTWWDGLAVLLVLALAVGVTR